MHLLVCGFSKRCPVVDIMAWGFCLVKKPMEFQQKCIFTLRPEESDLTYNHQKVPKRYPLQREDMEDG